MRGAVFTLSGLLLAALPVMAEVKKEILEFSGPSRGGPVTVRAELFLPDALAGTRLPAMLIHHGSGGVSNEREYAYAREFTAMGVAAIIPDSFTPRGVKSTVADQSAVTNNDMLADAFGALKAAAGHPRLDPARIGITGFSKGGTVALQSALVSVAERFAPGGPRFALHVPFYASCGTQYLNPKTTGAPMLVLIGGADTYVGSQPCLDYAAKIGATGGRVEAVVYPNAQHGWDGAGAAYRIANGENYSKCVYVEQPDRSWIEQTSGVMTNGPGGRAIEGANQKALAACRTLGVSGGPDADARTKSMAALKATMRAAFGLN
ncbi:dienelactone hydrolase family protein [Ferrovibrio sp.]|uniref:dienelactone hydrolase family protein n=1 Tax=Ferrovibrio sp. TaxID=1917215 RepID=UPI00262768FC|nr:dienelactone hydrolase family protein [Ferrovibrio sp.]